MLSIIIPVYNEATHIERLLSYLRDNISNLSNCELIIVDGGSTDSTVSQILKIKNLHPDLPLRLISSEKGRARQMNKGAAEARSSILYFLHADSFPPKDFDRLIVEHVHRNHPAGCFYLQFNSKHWWLRLVSWFTRFNWKIARGGDQSLFIEKALFNQIGGYNERYLIYEDNILIEALYRCSSFKVIPKALITSARLYEQLGVFYVQYHFIKIHLKRRLGASPEHLAAYYMKHLKTGT